MKITANCLFPSVFRDAEIKNFSISNSGIVKTGTGFESLPSLATHCWRELVNEKLILKPISNNNNNNADNF